jgi:hypothetical protein
VLRFVVIVVVVVDVFVFKSTVNLALVCVARDAGLCC